MKRFILGAVSLALCSLALAPANAGCHHRAMQMQLVRFQPFYVAPAPVVYQAPTIHQVQTIGGPGPTTYQDSAPVYGAPITESVQYAAAAPVAVAAPAPVAVQEVAQPTYVEAAPVAEVATESVAVESIPVEATHPVEAIAEAPVSLEAAPTYVEATAPVAAVEQVQVAAPAPVQYVEVAAPAPAPVQVQYVQAPAPAPVQYVSAPAAPTFVQTPPANRATVIQTFVQPAPMMYIQPRPQIIMMQAPRRGCLHH